MKKKFLFILIVCSFFICGVLLIVIGINGIRKHIALTEINKISQEIKVHSGNQAVVDSLSEEIQARMDKLGIKILYIPAPEKK